MRNTEPFPKAELKTQVGKYLEDPSAWAESMDCGDTTACGVKYGYATILN
jgi:hypothetical protein